jgi:uncharacterized protein (TIGR04551 family)
MGGMGQPGGMPNAPMGQQPKDEGPAQQAPEEPGQPSDLEPLSGYADQNRRRAQMFELDGYFRLRTDYMHNFNLGQGYSNQPRTEWTPPAPGQTAWTSTMPHGLPPFPVPLSCPVPAPGTNIDTTGATVSSGTGACGDKDISTASIRLRLEPTLNVTDQVRVRSQIDVLDNAILGSTPDSLAGLSRPYSDFVPQAPIPFLYNGQDPPEVGQNGYLSSIRAKRAWAEIDTEFGSLRFGRMPWHFGRGISYNDGSCLDCTNGTTVDRIALLTEVYGHQLTLALDYGSQGLTSNQLALGRYSPDGYPIDLAQDDDVFEYMFAVTKIDNPVQLRESIDRGDLVLNYGLQLVYRSQQMTYDDAACVPTMNHTNPDAPCMATTMLTIRDQAPILYDINAFYFQPNVWLKLYYRALTVEFEGTAVLGSMDHGGVLLAPDEERDKATFRQWGGVIASELHLYRDAFFVGFEIGGASGDQAEDPSQYLNYRWRFVRQPAGDHSIRDFKFSPEYHVDSILFRQILGTVTNAVYLKPAISYWFDLQQSRQLGLAGSFVYSLAQVPVATPGNALGYGLEMNISANYRNTAEGFYAGMTWGVLWPFGALDRPGIVGGESLWGTAASGAHAAQVLRGFLGVKF